MSQYKKGDRVRVGPAPVKEHDAVFSGQLGTILSEASWVFEGKRTQKVAFDEGGTTNLFEADLEPLELVAVAPDRVVRIRELEKEIADLKQEEWREGRDPATLPVGTTVLFASGSILVKQGENKWREFYVTNSGTGGTRAGKSILTNREVASYLYSTTNPGVVYKPTD